MKPSTKPSHTRPTSWAPTQQELAALYHYNPQTGIFTFATQRGGKQIGDVAGWITPAGYRRLSIDGEYWMAHQCAWLAHYGEWPAQILDHINKDKDDNRICNLRLSDYSENKLNCAKSESPTKGIHWLKANKKYTVQFQFKGCVRYFGSYATYEEALTRAHSVRAKLGLK